VVLQADEFIEGHRTILVCPFSTYLADAPLFRPTIEPDGENGLEFRSQAMVDKMTPAKIVAIGRVIGRLAATDMEHIETALINITGLRRPIMPIVLSGE